MSFSDWRDWVSISGWLIGAVSLYWGVKQSARAATAEEAERTTRGLLYRRKGIQQLLGLSEAAMVLQTRVEMAPRRALKGEAISLAADLTRSTSFFGISLPEAESIRLQAARKSLSAALAIITAQGEDTLQDFEKQQIEKLCLEAALELQALRGYLEMADELGEDPEGAKP